MGQQPSTVHHQANAAPSQRRTQPTQPLSAVRQRAAATRERGEELAAVLRKLRRLFGGWASAAGCSRGSLKRGRRSGRSLPPASEPPECDIGDSARATGCPALPLIGEYPFQRGCPAPWRAGGPAGPAPDGRICAGPVPDARICAGPAPDARIYAGPGCGVAYVTAEHEAPKGAAPLR
eukprot:gene14641-21316_t